MHFGFKLFYVIPWHIKERVGDRDRFIGYEHVTCMCDKFKSCIQWGN